MQCMTVNMLSRRLTRHSALSYGSPAHRTSSITRSTLCASMAPWEGSVWPCSMCVRNCIAALLSIVGRPT